MSRSQSRVVALLVVASVSVSVTAVAFAESFVESFDDGETSWRAEHDPQAVVLIGHRRQGHMLREGKGAELYQAQLGPSGGEIRLAHSLTPAVAIEDLRLSVWVKSNRAGLRLCMRLVFPDESAPETGGALTALVVGDRYQRANEWQQLTCAATADAVQDALRRTRYQANGRPLSTEGLYVDQAVLTGEFGPGTGAVEVLTDDLSFGPVISPARTNELLTAGLDVEAPDRPVEFRLNHLTVEGEPFFPIMAPFHSEAGETVAEFAATGANVAWIYDWRHDDLLASLRQAGLWATAIPPRPETEDGEVLDAQEAGMLPFGPETRPILFWNLGPRIQEIWLDQLIGWVRQLQAADMTYDRPTLADVTGAEYAFSNHVDMLGASRHITNTAIGYDDYRDWLRSRREEAFLNTFFWTWVQTEPTAQIAAARTAAGHLPIVIEPEQIRLQVYAALQAGCRGIGYWKTAPFQADLPGSEERRLALARLNLELRLLEPLIATGDKPGVPVAFSVAQPKPGSDGRRVRPSYHQITMTGPKAATTPFAPSERPPGKADAVLLKTASGPLLIAVWYGEAAQFCPGQMAKNGAKIVVPGVEETAAAWLITPTGVRHLPEKRVAGGKEITIDKFDQTAAVLFTTDHSMIDRYRRTAAAMAPEAARVTLELAKAKRIRVADVHRKLAELVPSPPDGTAMLRQADKLIAEADAAMTGGDYDGARQSAEDALQMLRGLQRAPWEDAVRQFPSPLASPHAVCFSTLPDHYRLIAKVGRMLMNPPDDANLLPTGDFEDDARMIEEGWRHTAIESASLGASGALVATSPKQGRYALQLWARRKDGAAASAGTANGAVVFKSPAMPVTAGQVLHISGWVKVVGAIPDHLDGATVHDSLLGPSSGLRWTKTKGWEPFEMLREVPQDGEFELTLTLHGAGEVHFDDLRVVPHTPRTSVAEQPGRGTAR
ncbi:MAG TPA: hypothetical protein VF170_06515 [Planctomycetaceae bacterium]